MQSMGEHLTDDDLDALFAKRLSFARSKAVGAHLQSCAECGARFDASPKAAASAAAMWRTDEHLQFDTDLAPYVDGTLGAAARDRVDAHAASCDVCAAELVDLLRWRAPRRPRWVMPASLAAGIAAVIVAAALLRDGQPARPAPPVHVDRTPVLRDGPHALRGARANYGRDDWNALAARALTTGSIDVVIPREVIPEPFQLRGGASTSGVVLEPSGIAVSSQTPRLRWSNIPNATYEAGIYRLGGGAVVTSERLDANEWIPARALPRGEIYVWQVKAFLGDTERVIPGPDESQPRFAVLSDETMREIDAARATGSHLLPALLFARAGALDDAAREIAPFSAENPQSAAAAALRKSLAAR
jgi:hypothetical protein